MIYPRILGVEDSDDEETHPVIDMSFPRIVTAMMLAEEAPSHVLECYRYPYPTIEFASACQDSSYYRLDQSDFDVDVRGIDMVAALFINCSYVVERRRRVYTCIQLTDGAYFSIPYSFTASLRIGVIESRFASRYGSSEGTTHCVAVETIELGRRRWWIGYRWIWVSINLWAIASLALARALLDAGGLDPSQAIQVGIYVSEYSPSNDHRKEDMQEKAILWILGGRL